MISYWFTMLDLMVVDGPTIVFPDFHKIGTNMDNKDISDIYNSAHPLDKEAINMYESMSNYLAPTNQFWMPFKWIAKWFALLLWVIASGLQTLFIRLFQLFRFDTWHTGPVGEIAHYITDFGAWCFIVVLICYIICSMFQSNSYRRYKNILRNLVVITAMGALMPETMSAAGDIVNTIAEHSPGAVRRISYSRKHGDDDNPMVLDNFADRVFRDNTISVPYRLTHIKPGQPLFNNGDEYIVPMKHARVQGIDVSPVMIDLSRVDDGSVDGTRITNEWNGMGKESIPQFLRQYGYTGDLLDTAGLSNLDKQYNQKAIKAEMNKKIDGKSMSSFMNTPKGRAYFHHAAPALALRANNGLLDSFDADHPVLGKIITRSPYGLSSKALGVVQNWMQKHHKSSNANYNKYLQAYEDRVDNANFQNRSNVTNKTGQKGASKQVKALNDILTEYLGSSGNKPMVEKFTQFDSGHISNLSTIHMFRESYNYYDVDWFAIFSELIMMIIIMLVFIAKLFVIFYKLLFMYIVNGLVTYLHGNNWGKLKQWFTSLFSLYEVLLVNLIIYWAAFLGMEISHSTITFILYDSGAESSANPITLIVVNLLADWALLTVTIRGVNSINSMIGPAAGGATTGGSKLMQFMMLRDMMGMTAGTIGHTKNGIVHGFNGAKKLTSGIKNHLNNHKSNKDSNPLDNNNNGGDKNSHAIDATDNPTGGNPTDNVGTGQRGPVVAPSFDTSNNSHLQNGLDRFSAFGARHGLSANGRRRWNRIAHPKQTAKHAWNNSKAKQHLQNGHAKMRQHLQNGKSKFGDAIFGGKSNTDRLNGSNPLDASATNNTDNPKTDKNGNIQGAPDFRGPNAKPNNNQSAESNNANDKTSATKPTDDNSLDNANGFTGAGLNNDDQDSTYPNDTTDNADKNANDNNNDNDVNSINGNDDNNDVDNTDNPSANDVDNNADVGNDADNAINGANLINDAQNLGQNPSDSELDHADDKNKAMSNHADTPKSADVSKPVNLGNASKDNSREINANSTNNPLANHDDRDNSQNGEANQSSNQAFVGSQPTPPTDKKQHKPQKKNGTKIPLSNSRQNNDGKIKNPKQLVDRDNTTRRGNKRISNPLSTGSVHSHKPAKQTKQNSQSSTATSGRSAKNAKPNANNTKPNNNQTNNNKPNNNRPASQTTSLNRPTNHMPTNTVANNGNNTQQKNTGRLPNGISVTKPHNPNNPSNPIANGNKSARNLNNINTGVGTHNPKKTNAFSNHDQPTNTKPTGVKPSNTLPNNNDSVGMNQNNGNQSGNTVNGTNNDGAIKQPSQPRYLFSGDGSNNGNARQTPSFNSNVTNTDNAKGAYTSDRDGKDGVYDAGNGNVNSHHDDYQPDNTQFVSGNNMPQSNNQVQTNNDPSNPDGFQNYQPTSNNSGSNFNSRVVNNNGNHSHRPHNIIGHNHSRFHR